MRPAGPVGMLAQPRTASAAAAPLPAGGLACGAHAASASSVSAAPLPAAHGVAAAGSMAGGVVPANLQQHHNAAAHLPPPVQFQPLNGQVPAQLQPLNGQVPAQLQPLLASQGPAVPPPRPQMQQARVQGPKQQQMQQKFFQGPQQRQMQQARVQGPFAAAVIDPQPLGQVQKVPQGQDNGQNVQEVANNVDATGPSGRNTGKRGAPAAGSVPGKRSRAASAGARKGGTATKGSTATKGGTATKKRTKKAPDVQPQFDVFGGRL